MGTRADFYVGIGKKAKWIGSVAWDGQPSGLVPDSQQTVETDLRKIPVLTAKTEKQFREAVKNLLKGRDDGTTPRMGWPWPWKNSQSTDYAYCFVEKFNGCNENMVVAVRWGKGFWRATAQEPTPENLAYSLEWPDMSKKQKVTYGPRSGTIII
jgi:hypothetical protein